MREPNDVLGRLHRVLVQEIVQRRPEYLSAPFSVAEIYQNLVPYRSHRDRIGVEMNGDYEDALLRLLAGQGDYLRLESEPALKALREELESSNPNTGVYREFAAVDVRLNAARIPLDVAAGAADAATEAVTPAAPRHLVSSAPVAEGETEPSGAAAPASSLENGEPTKACRWCRAELPERDHLNFCPFCGADVAVVPCAACGQGLEPEWRFCCACGTEVVN